jgi:hypothetical protein
VPKIVCPVQTVNAAFSREGFEMFRATCLSKKIKHLAEQVFYQANAPSYTAVYGKPVFGQKQAPMLEQPPYSSYLSCVYYWCSQTKKMYKFLSF